MSKATEVAEELKSWLENYDHKAANELMQIVGRLLASVPGGDRLEDAGFEPHKCVGWHELDLVGLLIESIRDKTDVEGVCDVFLEEGEE